MRGASRPGSVKEDGLDSNRQRRRTRQPSAMTIRCQQRLQATLVDSIHMLQCRSIETRRFETHVVDVFAGDTQMELLKAAIAVTELQRWCKETRGSNKILRRQKKSSEDELIVKLEQSEAARQELQNQIVELRAKAIRKSSPTRMRLNSPMDQLHTPPESECFQTPPGSECLSTPPESDIEEEGREQERNEKRARAGKATRSRSGSFISPPRTVSPRSASMLTRQRSSSMGYHPGSVSLVRRRAEVESPPRGRQWHEQLCTPTPEMEALNEREALHEREAVSPRSRSATTACHSEPTPFLHPFIHPFVEPPLTLTGGSSANSMWS
jgi:hypothetical protein